jgi:hypothetical protein
MGYDFTSPAPKEVYSEQTIGHVSPAKKMGLAALRSGLRPMLLASPFRLTAHRTGSHPIRHVL